MNQREVFIKVSKHLLKQNTRSYSPETEDCYYRIDKTVGYLSCAIGCLINDEHYSEELENQSVDAYQVQSAISKSLSSIGYEVFLNVEDKILLSDLQEVHDNNSPELWDYKLSELAAKYFDENLNSLGVTA